MRSEKEIMSSWVESQSNPMVSIKCLAYNHEKYIGKCLEALLNQITNFSFEIVVHDDCSTDGTKDIIRKFESEYPDIIRPIYENENLYSKDDDSLNKAINPYLRGKYLAFCECDDLWLDDHKLQKQIDILESNEKCSLVLSDGYVGKTPSEVRRINPYNIDSNGYINIDTIFISKNYLVPTCSMVCKMSLYLSMPEFCKKSPVGDKPIRMWCSINGDVYYFAEPMVFYRRNSGTQSFGYLAKDVHYAFNVYHRFCEFLDDFDNYTNFTYHYLIQFMKQKEEFTYLGRIKDYKAMLNCSYMNNKFVKVSLIYKMKLWTKAYCPNIYSFFLKVKNLGFAKRG